MAKSPYKRKVVAVVLAAGKGKRMHSQLPKVLHQVSGLPMVLLVIDTLRKANLCDIIVVVGYGKDRIREVLPKDVKTVDQGRLLGTGHALSRVKRLLSGYRGDLVVTCADTPLVETGLIKRLIVKHQRDDSSCTLASGYLENPQGYGRILRDKSSNLLRINEDTPKGMASPRDTTGIERKQTEINSGMYCFRAPALFKILPLITRNNIQKEYYLTDIVHLLIQRGYKVNTTNVKNPQQIIGVNSRKDLALVNRIMNHRIIEQHMQRGVTVLDPDTTYIDIRVKIGKDTVINPFTVIEGKVSIGRGCVIGPFTHLRDKTVVKDGAEIGNFVEVKKSSIGKHTKAKHLSYLGDATLGKGVNIGAGTITANYDGEHKYPTTIKDKAFIGTHTTLVAPVTVGKGAATGAGTVVLRNRNVPAHTIVVGVPARVLRKKPSR